MLGFWNVLSMDPTWVPVFIFLARVTDVSIGTMRLICVTRGRRPAAVVLGFFEVLIWVTAVSKVLSDLDRWANILAYAGGFATGSALGMWIEQKVAMGMQVVTFFSRGRAHAVAERLRFADYVVTALEGSGRDGPVAMCMAIVPRRRTEELVELAREIDPDVHITIEDVRQSTAGLPRSNLAGKIATISS
jgi:uncharacterized protein YebE (UPF0316 family)